MTTAAELAVQTTWRKKDWQQALDILGSNTDILLPATLEFVSLGYHPVDAASMLIRTIR